MRAWLLASGGWCSGRFGESDPRSASPNGVHSIVVRL